MKHFAIVAIALATSCKIASASEPISQPNAPVISVPIAPGPPFHFEIPTSVPAYLNSETVTVRAIGPPPSHPPPIELPKGPPATAR